MQIPGEDSFGSTVTGRAGCLKNCSIFGRSSSCSFHSVQTGPTATQSLFQWELGGQSGRGVNLATDLIVLRLKCSEVYLRSLIRLRGVVLINLSVLKRRET